MSIVTDHSCLAQDCENGNDVELVRRAQVSARVVGIYVAESGGADPVSQERATAIAGKGLAGDRYANGSGFYSELPTTPGARELTLIDREAVEAAFAAVGEPVDFASTRRNVVTEGVHLRGLIGKQFTIGSTICEGVRDCPPCNHLEELTGLKLMKPFIYTGGLRARVVADGEFAVGDPIIVTGDATNEWESPE